MTRFMTAVVAIGLGFMAAPSRAEVTATSAAGFVIRDTATVKATPLETWIALTKPGEWWSDQHTWSGDAANMTLTPQGGGCFCERIPGKDGKDGSQLDGSVQHGMVVQASPLKLLRLIGSLGPLQSEPVVGVLTFAMKDVEGGTQIQMEYNVAGPMRYKVAEIAPLVDKVMTQQLGRLRDHLGALGAEGSSAAESDTPGVGAQIDALAKDKPESPR